MLEIEINGKKVEVREGSTIMEAARQAGIYIPHFCYHKKLSIAASCRMCLVEVEKAPRAIPACASSAANGMKVFTHSELAVKAQKSVMEFLLINHPLDCPVCDQGGECQLQDIAVGYGGIASRYHEEKRVVVNKNLGPLIATDMTRCIHCTRCVRFTQEIAGQMELGQAFRGEHAEIMPFIEQTVDSELSGNLIDLCPVGALTSKPFRFSARTWEMARRRSVSPHDALGSNLIVQVRRDKVMRVLPLENEAINECWLSDKDRFSYEGLYSPDRLTRPMVKQGGTWSEVEWNVALDYVAHALRDIAGRHGAGSIGTLVSPHATLEEMYLAQRLTRGLGSNNIDFRLRHSDFSLDGKRRGIPWLGMRIDEFAALDRVLLVGAFLRKEQPLLAQRLRQSAKRGAEISLIHVVDDDLAMPVAGKLTGLPSQLPALLGQVVDAAAGKVATPEAERIVRSLRGGERVGIFLGNHAEHHPQASVLQTLARRLADLLGASFGILGEAANSVGGYAAGAVPSGNGLNAADMLAQPRKAYLLMQHEAELDGADGLRALAALREAEMVAVFSPFCSTAALEYADVLLPVAPFAETSGSFVNCEGRVQSFNAVTPPLDETRPLWKVLRVMGNLLGLGGFDYNSSEDARAEALGGSREFIDGLDNGAADASTLSLDGVFAVSDKTLERIAEVPIYHADSLARRAQSLQRTRDAAPPAARVHPETAAALGLADGDAVLARRAEEGAQGVRLILREDESVPQGAARIAAAHHDTLALGAMFGALVVEKA